VTYAYAVPSGLMTTPVASLGTDPSDLTAPDVVSSCSMPFSAQYAPPGPAAIIQANIGSISVLATTLPEEVRISSHSLPAPIAAVATT